jgi:predicted phage terminase large subunit-like protein
MRDNIANLSSSTIETLEKIYAGTRLGRQELYGDILEDAEGALWNVALIEPFRVEDYDGRFVTLRDGTRVEIERIAVAIDPAVTTNEQSDETGIIVAGLGADGRIYVLDDASGKYSPRQWARAAMSLYERYKADCIVAEVNQGGDLVTEVLRAEAGQGNLARIKTVHAKRGKYLRAEPIAAYYEKGLVSHAGYFGPLEKQMLNFQGFTGENSPDRLDALVYAIGELMLGTVSHAFW